MKNKSETRASHTPVYPLYNFYKLVNVAADVPDLDQVFRWELVTCSDMSRPIGARLDIGLTCRPQALYKSSSSPRFRALDLALKVAS